MSWVLERVVFVEVELLLVDLMGLDWFFFSVVVMAFVVELLVPLMDLIGLVWFLLSMGVFFLAISSSFSEASIRLPRDSSFWGWASKKVNINREEYRRSTNKKERGLLVCLEVRNEEEEAI